MDTIVIFSLVSLVITAEDITAKIAPTWEYSFRMTQRWPMRWLTPFTDARKADS